MKTSIEFVELNEYPELSAIFKITPNISNNGIYSKGSYKIKVVLSCFGIEIGNMKELDEKLENIIDYIELEILDSIKTNTISKIQEQALSYLKSRGCSVDFIREVIIQHQPTDGNFNHELVIKWTGTPPKKNNK